MNDAIRSDRSRDQLVRIIQRSEPSINWQMRVEPAFGRALNYVVGEGFADWARTAQRTALQLTKIGIASYDAISMKEDVLVDEKAFLTVAARTVTEDFVSQILRAGRGD